MINLACMCVAILNLLISIATWIACSKEGQTGSRSGGGSTMGAMTVAMALLMLILTALYNNGRGGWGSGANVNMEVNEAVASFTLPNVLPGNSEVHIKRTYKTEEIFIKNITCAPPMASGDGALVPAGSAVGGATYQTVRQTHPIRRAASSGSIADGFDSERQLDVHELRSSPAPSRARYVEVDKPLYRQAAAPVPVIPPTCPTCIPREEGESLTERSVEKMLEKTEMKQLPIRDLGSQGESLEPEKITPAGGREAADKAEKHVRLPIQVDDEMFSTIEDVQVEIICKRARKVTQTKGKGPGAQTTIIREEPALVESGTASPEPSVSPTGSRYESIEKEHEKVIKKSGGHGRGHKDGKPQPSLVTFEPSADVFFNIEEARYRYEPANPALMKQVAISPCRTMTERDENFQEHVVKRSISSGVGSGAGSGISFGGKIKQIPVKMQQGSQLGSDAFLFPNTSCANICSRCGNFRKTSDDLFYILCKVVWMTLLIVGVFMMLLILMFKANWTEIKAAVLAALESGKKDARQSIQGALSWIDNVHVHPTAVGFAFGVIFMCVILGSAYYYEQRTPAHMISR